MSTYEDQKEIERIESEIGFNDGRGGSFDPHAEATLKYHMYKSTGNSQMVDISDPSQAQELIDAGLVTPFF